MAEVVQLSAVIGGPNCVSSDDGHAVYQRIARYISENEDVSVSFAGVDDLTTAFLNAAIGKLYGEFPEQTIRAHLQVTDADADQLALLKLVVDRAKEFFRDPDTFNAAIRSELGDE